MTRENDKVLKLAWGLTSAAPITNESFEDRIDRHMPRSDDLTLLVLKGHLLVEEGLDALLRVLLKNPEALAPANLNLFSRLCIVRALFGNTEMIDAAIALNNLRNKLAHHLEHPQVERLTNDFISRFEKRFSAKINDPSDALQMSLARRLRRCINYLCGYFNGAAEGYLDGRAGRPPRL
jgi:hypothetical protein